MASSELDQGGVRSTVAAPSATDSRPVGRRGSRLRSRLVVIGGTLTACFVVVSVIGPLIAPYDPLQPDVVNRLAPPGTDHLLGTDFLGRDQLSRLLHGSRLSLIIGLSVGVSSLIVGTAIGLVAGLQGGWLDHVLMRATDVLLAFPGVLIAVAIIAALGPSMPNLIVALTINAIPIFARVARSSTLGVKSRPFVEAARSLGGGSLRIALRHVLPNILGPLMVLFSFRVGAAIVTASALSFLGLGARPPTPEWGAMLSEARNYLRPAPHLAVAPGLAISVVVLGLSLLGDGLRDALDPHTLAKQRASRADS